MQHKTKSILIINRTFPPIIGATGRMAFDLANHIAKQGHKITILTTGEDLKNSKLKNINIIRIGTSQKPNGIFDYLKILWNMDKSSKKTKDHDIVISMTDPPLQIIIGNKIAKRMNAKHIHWAMDLYPDLLPVVSKSPPKFIYNFIKNKINNIMKNTDAIVVISKCMAKYLTHSSIPRTNMHVIENWSDLKKQSNPTSLFNDKKFRILYAGTIGLAHEFDTILKSAQFLQNRTSNIEFIFTSRGGQKDLFVKKCKKLKLNNIHFLPYQPAKKLSSLMISGDLHLITMKKESLGKLFPSKFYSACQAGRPILFVGPKQCEIHEKITKSNCGISIRNGDSKSLVQAIIKYYQDGKYWQEHSQNSSDILNNHNPLNQWNDLIKDM